MIQSEYSRELEDFAKQVDGTHDDFIRFMGEVPQLDGVDKELAEYIRENPDTTHDDVLYRYCELAILDKE